MTDHYAQRLTAVLDYGFSRAEADAYRLALIWEDETRKMFPELKLARLPAHGDPRKSSLFRFCWKLWRETRGLLPLDEYQWYIRANLKILKHFNARITPNGICGDKAWIRYKVWKREFDKKDKNTGPELAKALDKIDVRTAGEIDRTRKFLAEKTEGLPTYDKLAAFVKDGWLGTWLQAGKISGFYLVLSPWLAQLCDGRWAQIERETGMSVELWKSKVTPAVEAYFRSEFAVEFSTSIPDAGAICKQNR